MESMVKKMLAFMLAAIMGICMSYAQTHTVTHIVERGETLSSIAKRYGTSNEKILELNPEASQFIYVGMELKVPVIGVTEQSSENVIEPRSAKSYHKIDNSEKESREVSGNSEKEVLHSGFAVAQYQLGDFRSAEYTSIYGLGLMFPSITHWGALHIGGNLNFSINAGIVDNWGCMIDFGPSVRYDIADNVFINMPVDARCVVTFPEGSTYTRADWGMQIAPALHVFFTKKFGIYVGPLMTTGFYSGAKPSFGLVAGISYDF